jgi:DUF4097 and DUF4098 domain-containing protein YvlB
MTRKWSIVLLVATVALCIAGLALAGEPYRENFDQSYPLAAGGRVSLSNVNGNVTVGVWDQPTVRVQAVKEAESKELLDKLQVEVKAAAGRVEIETSYPERSHGHMSVEYTLTVPKGASLDEFELVNGGLTVSGLGGEVRASLVNGPAKLTGLAGNVTLESVNGEVQVELDALGTGKRVKLETVNGPMQLRLAAGVAAEVEAETVNGHLSNDFGIPVHKHEYVGADMKGSIGTGGGDIRLETVNGRIELLKK